MQSKSYYYTITLCTLLSTIQNHGSIQQLLLIPDIGGLITISAPGTYILGNDITGDINIESSQVVLDLNGHTITGGRILITTGTSLNDIIIHNGTLRNTTADNNSIAFFGTPANRHRNLTVSNIIIDDPILVGIRFDECDNILISNVFVTGAGNGIRLTNTTFATIENARIQSCTNVGIFTADDCNQVLIRDSIVFDCTSVNSIGFDVGNLCQLVRCIASDNAGIGFRCNNGPGILSNCSALQNTGDGIQIITGNWEVLNCQANSNGSDGIHAMSPTNVIIKLCQVAYNAANGILLNTNTGGSIEGCSAIRNTGAGFNNVNVASPVNYSANLASNNLVGSNYVNVVTNVPVIYATSTEYWRNIMEPAA